MWSLLPSPPTSIVIPAFTIRTSKMSKYLIFALVVVLACFASSVSSQTVNSRQAEVLGQIAEEWPALKVWATKPWNSTNIEKACTGGLIFVGVCNGTGWVRELSFTANLAQASRVPIPPLSR